MIKVGEKKGDFLIKAEIGKGGMGTIYYATDMMLNRDIALKVIHPQLTNNTQLMERFKIEAMTQARMNHPNIVTIFSFSKIDGDNIIAMEYIEGKNLKDLLIEKRILPLDEALDYLKQILKGLEYSHSRNVIHRDIKPANILITEDGRVKLSDFGIAKVFGKQGLTKTGMLLGTPWYTPPEQILGEKIDFRSDLYSVGITFYEMMTGTVPFDSETNSDFQIQKAHLETPPPRPSIYNPEIGTKIEQFILKALQKKPEKRFQSASEMLKAVRDLEKKVTESTMIRKGKTTLLESDLVKRGRKRSWKRSVLLTLASLIIISGALAFYLFVIKPSHKPINMTNIEAHENSPKIIPKKEETVKSEPESEIVPVKSEKENLATKKKSRDQIQTGKSTTSSVSKTKKMNINIPKKSNESANLTNKKRIEKKSRSSEAKKVNIEVKSNENIPESTNSEGKKGGNISEGQSNFNIDAELLNLRTRLENRDFKGAKQKVDEMMNDGIRSAKLYSFAGKLNFFTRNFEKAEKFWSLAIEKNGSINLSFFHKHGIFNKGCSGQLILKKGLIIFDSLTKPSHSLALTTDKIKKIEKPKNSFGIKISYLSKKKVRKNIFILRGRNRNGEKFLAYFINKYILEDR